MRMMIERTRRRKRSHNDRHVEHEEEEDDEDEEEQEALAAPQRGMGKPAARNASVMEAEERGRRPG